MNQKIKEVMSKVPTDVSGKWMSVENVKSFAEILIIERIKKGECILLPLGGS